MLVLKPLDVVVAVRAATLAEPGWTIAAMASQLGMDVAQVYRSTRQAAAAGFLIGDKAGGRIAYRVHHAALLEFLVHGVKYCFVATRGRLTRGVPTAHAAPAMAGRIRAGAEPVPVWPDPEGAVRGESFEPLHRCVPGAARRDVGFYAAMSLIDAIRDGRARERELAARLLREALRADSR